MKEKQSIPCNKCGHFDRNLCDCKAKQNKIKKKKIAIKILSRYKLSHWEIAEDIFEELVCLLKDERKQ